MDPRSRLKLLASLARVIGVCDDGVGGRDWAREQATEAVLAIVRGILRVQGSVQHRVQGEEFASLRVALRIQLAVTVPSGSIDVGSDVTPSFLLNCENVPGSIASLRFDMEKEGKRLVTPPSWQDDR